MKKVLSLVTMIALAAFVSVGCSTTPDSASDRANLSDDVTETIRHARTTDSGINEFFNNSYGYAVFPSVGKGGALVGGAWGRGEVYEQGRMIGYCTLTQASIGAQLGGQKFSEIIFFENKSALDDFTGGDFEFSAQASAVALQSGSTANARYRNGVAIFTMGEAGLMYEASIGGQKFNFDEA